MNAVARGSSSGSLAVWGLLAIFTKASGYPFPSRTPLRWSSSTCIFSPWAMVRARWKRQETTPSFTWCGWWEEKFRYRSVWGSTPHCSSKRLYTSASPISNWLTETRASPFRNITFQSGRTIVTIAMVVVDRLDCENDLPGMFQRRLVSRITTRTTEVQLFQGFSQLAGIHDFGSSIPTWIIDINYHQLPTFRLQCYSPLQGTSIYNTGNTA